jgi:hypothetical protein
VANQDAKVVSASKWLKVNIIPRKTNRKEIETQQVEKIGQINEAQESKAKNIRTERMGGGAVEMKNSTC